MDFQIPGSYGFRPLRSTADAISQCHKTLVQRGSAEYILEGDIKSCFDKSFLDLIEIAKTPIRRHIKIKCEATPYDPAFQEYIAKRLESRKSN